MSSKEPTSRNSNRSPRDEPDVLLDIPQLKVDEIGLEVEDLKARVSLHAGVGELVNLAVGADVNLGKVKLDIKGVEAQALLKVRLENVLAILDRALSTVDGNPEVLRSLTRTVGSTVDQAGDLARRALGEGGAVSDAVGLVGDITGRAMGEDGTVSQAAGGVSQATQGGVNPIFRTVPIVNLRLSGCAAPRILPVADILDSSATSFCCRPPL